MAPLRVAIVGYGKIAKDQHVPAIEADPRFELAAVVSPRSAGAPDVPCFASHQQMLAEMTGLDAVAICTPPSARYPIARDCIESGLHTLLEKPPGVTVGEVEALTRIADPGRPTLFFTWHAQHNEAVATTRKLLEGQRVKSMRIVWREDVRKWHPGQQWIWEPGGFGVFDPGINAFSIASHIMPGALFVRRAELFFPSNRQAPIAAELELASPAADEPIACTLDWRHGQEETWTIEIVSADDQRILLSGGGSRLAVDGKEMPSGGPGEYPAIYDHFAALVGAGRSSADVEPLRMVADSFLVGRRNEVEPFEDG